MAVRSHVPKTLVQRLRGLCLALPASYEEAAWTGTRWKIGRRVFAHVVRIEAGWPPAYAKAAGTAGPYDVLTFRVPASKRESNCISLSGYFEPGWWPDIAGLRIGAETDWSALAECIGDSYCMLAPKRLLDGAMTLIPPRR